jgi:hypothetical protein
MEAHQQQGRWLPIGDVMRGIARNDQQRACLGGDRPIGIYFPIRHLSGQDVNQFVIRISAGRHFELPGVGTLSEEHPMGRQFNRDGTRNTHRMINFLKLPDMPIAASFIRQDNSSLFA